MTPIQVTECQRALDEELYVEPKKDEILGSLILLNDRWRCQHTAKEHKTKETTYEDE